MRYLLPILLLAAATPAHADTLRLHDLAGVRSDTVTLADVATLTGDHAQSLADTVVARFRPGQRELRLTVDQLRAALTATATDERPVRWSSLSVQGHRTCLVQRLDEPAPTPAPLPAEPAAVNPPMPVVAAPVDSLHAALTAHVADQCNADPTQLRVTIAGDPPDLPPAASLAVLDHPGPWLGDLTLTLLVNEQPQPITLHVARRALVVTAQRPVRVGHRLADRDLTLAPAWLSDPDAAPITDPALVLGQRVRRALALDEMLTAHDVQGPPVIRRGDAVTVTRTVGSLQIQVVARAARDASLGETLTLRTDTGQSLTAVASGLREAQAQGN